MIEKKVHRHPWNCLLLIAGMTLLAAGCDHSAPQTNPAPSSASSNEQPQDADDVAITEADVDMPKSYGIALERIKSYRDTIRTAVTTGQDTKAHRPLDELDIVLDKLTSIARDSGVSKERWEDVNTSAKELRGLFNQVHSAIDEKRKPDWAAVGDPIDEVIGRLESISAENRSGESAPESDSGN